MATMFSSEQPLMSLYALAAGADRGDIQLFVRGFVPQCFREGVLPKPPVGTAPASSDPMKKRRVAGFFGSMDTMLSLQGAVGKVETVTAGSYPIRGKR